jgi:malonyl-CoA O-methyltransferase
MAVEVATEQELVWYPDLPQLLQAIKRIGAGTAHPQRGGGLGWRRVLHDMAALYRERYGTDQGVPASYQVIYGTGRR